MWELQEALTHMYAAKLKSQPARLDGYRIPQLTARFRSSFKAAIQVAVAKGVAMMLMKAGVC